MKCSVCQTTNRPGAHYCSQCRAPFTLLGKYRITRRLGRGGYGAVYQAEHLQLGGAVFAIKELIPDANATPAQVQAASAQFRLEASILANLDHSALPKVVDFFTEGNRDYLVMEYIAGDTLEECLERNGAPFAEAQVLTWAQELCDALAYLHSRQPPIIHRDIKPSNIKIAPDGKLRLLDFGIAKLHAAGIGTQSAARAVTPPYSPMEQYGKGTDARSDIYALGVTLYELLTNHLPPDAPDRVGEAVIPPRQINPMISPNIEAVILKAMAEKMSDRYQNAPEMKNALTAPTYQSMVGDPAPLPFLSADAAANPPFLTRNQIMLFVSMAMLVVCALLAVPFIQSQQAQANFNATAERIAMVMQTAQAATAQVEAMLMAQAQATQTAQAQATQTAQAQANAAATARAQSTLTIQTQATQTAQAVAQARALATSQAQATQTAQANGTATARARTPQATSTPTVFVTMQSPFKDLTFGRGGVGTQRSCQVATNATNVSQLALVDDRYFYFAMPFQSNDVGKKIIWSVLDSSGNSFIDSTERTLEADDQSCFWQGFPVDAVSNPGRYVLQITYLGAVVYRAGFTIEYADTSARRPQRNPLGQFTFGRGGVNNTTCQPNTVTDRVNQSDLKDDEWFYYTSPFTLSDIGNTFSYSVYWPSGSVAYDHVESTIKNQFWLCKWGGFSLGDAPDKGRYRIVIEYKSRVVFEQFFYIQ